MKAKIILGIALALLIVILFIPQKAAAQVYTPPDSCLWTMPIDSANFYNPDSCKVDTCKDSPTHNEYYGNKYILQYDRWIYIFKLRPLLIDSFYTWRDIDTVYHSQIRNFYQTIENKYGKYYLKRDPDYNDSDFVEIPTCQIIFDNFINIYLQGGVYS